MADTAPKFVALLGAGSAIGLAGAAALRAVPPTTPGPAPEPKKIPILVTGAQLDKCTTTLSPARCEEMAGLINEMCDLYGVKTQDALHEPLANFLQESLEFNHRIEYLNYRAVTLVKVWGNRFYLGTPKAGKLNAELFARQPKLTGNAVYGAKNNKLGNRPGTDDGYNLRGRGFVGLTGFYVLNEYRKFKGFDTVEQAAEYASGSDRGALDSAFWYAYVLKDLMDDAERDDMIGIVHDINGGENGLSVRMMYYGLCKKWITPIAA